MSAIVHDYIETYLKGLASMDTDSIAVLEEYAQVNNVPIIQKEAGRLLETLIYMIKPLKILELGTAIGYSSILMSRCAGRKARITTIERDPGMVRLARINISNFDCEDNIEILEGDCLEILKDLQDKYDFIFIDAGKGHYGDFFPHCARLLNENGIIVSDNVLFRGMVASDELIEKRMSTIVKRMREYLDMLLKNKEFHTSVIPIGDGIAVTVRRN
ncbi:MAG: O-methyltransferase [Clostridiaceae bacterium]